MRFLKIPILLIPVFLILSVNTYASNECSEKFSRGVFKFNMGFDKVVLKPIAKGFNKLPDPIKKGTGNFTSNVATLLSIPNHVLQGSFVEAGHASASFLVNTTIGILGFGNPASAMGLRSQKEDVGQTLGTYGVGSGCYFVLPILGPTTVRDSFGLVADSFIDPFSLVTWREKELLGISGSKLDFVSVKGATAVEFRGSNMLNFDSLEKNSIDMYASMKSIYLQDREKKIKNVSDSGDDDDWGNLDK